jgi:hypothetical protein
MVNYQLGKIYKITSIHTDLIYVGSTTERLLCQRLRGHNKSYKQFLKGNVGNITSFELLKLGNCKIELIELFPCSCKDELIARESYWIRQLECVNKRIESRTKEEYYTENKVKILQKNKEYRQATNYDTKYYQQNKTQKNQNSKTYYENNKEEILEQRAEKITCECGCKIRKDGLSDHHKTPKHIRLMNLKKDNI